MIAVPAPVVILAIVALVCGVAFLAWPRRRVDLFPGERGGPPPPRPLRGGYVDKGGVMDGPSQVVDRPPPPAPFRPGARGAYVPKTTPPADPEAIRRLPARDDDGPPVGGSSVQPPPFPLDGRPTPPPSRWIRGRCSAGVPIDCPAEEAHGAAVVGSRLRGYVNVRADYLAYLERQSAEVARREAADLERAQQAMADR